jgi:hypothetical protein
MKTVILSALLAASLAAPASAQAIGGSYAVAGTNFDGSPYTGTAEITLTSQTTCVIEWQTGNSNSEGICMRNDDAFSAGYVMGDQIGLIVYKVMEDGSLHGLWTIAGQEGNGTEVLKPAE